MVFIHLHLLRDKSKFIGVVSSGKAYVRGYEVDKQVPSFITFDKARTTQSKNNVASAFRIGNFLKIKFVYGLPDINSSGDLNAYSTVTLQDTAAGSVSNNATATGNAIGFARVRAYENFGTDSDGDVDQLHLFDVQMFTKLTTASTSLAKGQKIKGQTSGATGIVAEAVSSGTTVLVHSVVGNFQTGENIQKMQTSTGAVAISAVRNYDVGRIRSVFQDRGANAYQEFGADVVLEDNKTLTGSGTVTLDGDSSNDTITGISTKFTSELIEGDKLLLPNGATTSVVSVTDNDTVVVSDITGSSGVVISGNIVRQRAKFYKPDQTVAISGLPNSGIKDISIETEIVKREEIATVSSNQFTISSTDGTFVAFSKDAYAVSAENNGQKFALQSSNLSINNSANAGNVQFTLSGIPDSTKVKVISTVQRGSVTASNKTLVKGAVLLKLILQTQQQTMVIHTNTMILH